MVFDGAGQFTHVDREITVFHLSANHGLERFVLIGDRPENFDGCPGNVHGHKKGKSHDMVPVGMRQIDLCGNRAPGQVVDQHGVGQIADSGAGVNDHMTIHFGETEFDTGGITSVFHCFRPRTGNGAAYAPELDPYHAVTPLPSVCYSTIRSAGKSQLF